MALITSNAIEYPESDGLPMGETEVHIDWLIRLRDIFRWRYRGQRVYVGANMLLYFEEGQPTRNIVPDIFVVLDCDPRQRRIFKTWEEKRIPNVAFEITSRSTEQQDIVAKPWQYAHIGVKEWFLFDPTGEYLDPPFMGFRLAEDGYLAIEPNKEGGLESQELGLVLRLERRWLKLYDRQTGELLLTEAEAERAGREAERAGREAERASRETAERRAEEMEEELRRLREEVKRLRPEA
jgi:Uma2 family endonuclease